MIVSKNLFDPERGAGATREAEENSRAFQRLRNLILLGTVIIGSNRTGYETAGMRSAAGQACLACSRRGLQVFGCGYRRFAGTLSPCW